MENLNVSEQMAEQSSGETGSLSAVPDVPHSQGTQSAPMAASVAETPGVDSPRIAPDHEAPKADAPQAEAPKVEAAKAEAPQVEAPKVEAPKVEPAAPRAPGKLMIMSPGDRSWDGDKAGTTAETEPASGIFGKRRFAALAAVVVLAAVMGALGGALATASLSHLAGDDAAGPGNHALEASVARIDADLLALKASVENTTKLGMSQYNKTSDRLDRVEKAQTEPAAKLARLSEAVDKLRAAPQAAPVAAVPAPAKEVTGSIAPPANASPGAPAAAKTEVGRLPTVEGWVLRDVANGGALIEGRQGIYEVYAGDPVPGLGRVDAIRKQDGRWVVVTTKGLVVAR
jgi:hypothetical protein